MFNKSQFKPAFVTALVAICVAFGESVKLETTLTNKQYTVEVKLTPRQQKKKERKEKQKAQKQRNDSARSFNHESTVYPIQQCTTACSESNRVKQPSNKETAVSGWFNFFTRKTRVPEESSQELFSLERQNKSGITDKHRGRLFKCQIIKKVLRFEATERVEKEKLLRLAQNYSKFNDGVDFRETIISHLKGTNGYKVDEIAQEVIVKKLDSDAVHEYIINRAIEIQNEEAQKKADELNEPKRYSKRELHKRVRNYLKETYTTEHTKEIFDYHIKQALKRKEYHHRFIQLYMMAFESCNLNTNSDVMKHIEDEVFTIFTQQMYHCIEEYKVNVLKCKNIYKVFEKLQLERFRYDKALVEEWFTELGEDERRDVLYIINQFYVEVFNFVMQGYKDTILGKEKYERCSINGDDDDDSDDDE